MSFLGSKTRHVRHIRYEWHCTIYLLLYYTLSLIKEVVVTDKADKADIHKETVRHAYYRRRTRRSIIYIHSMLTPQGSTNKGKCGVCDPRLCRAYHLRNLFEDYLHNVYYMEVRRGVVGSFERLGSGR